MSTVRSVVVAIVVVAAGCGGAADSSSAVDGCDGSRTSAGEIELGGSEEIQGWVLTFGNWPIEAGSEAKLVWRVTGSGDATFRARRGGDAVEPVWGPDRHGSSNWVRPGDEWGTGWILDVPGCWTLEVERDGGTLDFDVDVGETR